MFFKKKPKPEPKKADTKVSFPEPGPAETSEPAVAVFEQPARIDPIALEFSLDGSGLPHLVSGWSKADAKGSWTVGPNATIDLSALEGVKSKSVTLGFNFGAYLAPPEHASQDVSISVGGVALGTWTVTDTKLLDYEVVLPEGLLISSPAVVEFGIAKPMSPASTGSSKDGRALGIRLRSLTVRFG